MAIENVVHETSAKSNEAAIVVFGDEELAQLGLARVNAFVRTEQSKNALRVQKSRKKSEEKGIKQLNVQARPEVHAVLKRIAKETLSNPNGLSIVLHDLLTEHRPATGNLKQEIVQPGKSSESQKEILSKILDLKGWRRWIVILLGIL